MENIKMIKYILSLVFVVILSVVLALTFLYKNTEFSSELPPKPNNIPKLSLWVGGPDGGVYVLIEKSSQSALNTYNATIHYSEGSISYKGRLIINTDKEPLFDYKDANSYSAWDGDTLYLQDGRFLKIP